MLEDNGGGVHLFLFVLFDGQDNVVFTSDYSQNPTNLVDDVSAFLKGDDPATWESNYPADFDVTKFYKELSTDYASTLVAQGDEKDTEFFWDQMGASASEIFSRRVYWIDQNKNNAEVLLVDTGLDTYHSQLTNEELLEAGFAVAEELDLAPAEIYVDGPFGILLKK